jgi:hypothetical protein
MFSRISKGLVLALSLAASTVAVGCAGTADENVASDEGAATAASGLAHDYEGTIGNLKVLVRIDAQGSAISGSYFYSDKVGNGDQLILKGSVSGSKLTMTESVNGAGAATGTFNGNIGANGITGTWKAGNTTLPLNLTAIKSLKTVQHKYKAEIKAVKTPDNQWARDCSLEAEVVEIYGLDAKIEKTMMDSLKVDPLEKDQQGHCDSDIRFVSQTVGYNGNGLLSIDVSTEYDGGAHPENQADAFNFVVASGANLAPADVFAAGSKAKLKDLIEAQMRKDDPDADKKDENDFSAISEFENHWDLSNDSLPFTMSVSDKGVTINMGNEYPHVILALAPVVTLSWADVKPLLKAGTPVAVLAK